MSKCDCAYSVRCSAVRVPLSALWAAIAPTLSVGYSWAGVPLSVLWAAIAPTLFCVIQLSQSAAVWSVGSVCAYSFCVTIACVRRYLVHL